jgi:hypothetical protein
MPSRGDESERALLRNSCREEPLLLLVVYPNHGDPFAAGAGSGEGDGARLAVGRHDDATA